MNRQIGVKTLPSLAVGNKVIRFTLLRIAAQTLQHLWPYMYVGHNKVLFCRPETDTKSVPNMACYKNCDINKGLLFGIAKITEWDNQSCFSVDTNLDLIHLSWNTCCKFFFLPEKKPPHIRTFVVDLYEQLMGKFNAFEKTYLCHVVIGDQSHWPLKFAEFTYDQNGQEPKMVEEKKSNNIDHVQPIGSSDLFTEVLHRVYQPKGLAHLPCVIFGGILVDWQKNCPFLFSNNYCMVW